jgi:hypothetical protein
MIAFCNRTPSPLRLREHDVDCFDYIRDGNTPVELDAGFEITPGDYIDIQVGNAHPWGCGSLVLGRNGIGETVVTANTIRFQCEFQRTRYSKDRETKSCIPVS